MLTVPARGQQSLRVHSSARAVDTRCAVFDYRVEVTWGECDIAGLVYFPRIVDWCHRALEALFGGLPGGYPALTGPRRTGIPTVKITGEFRAPMRYGDAVFVRVSVARIGRTSLSFVHEVIGDDQVLRAQFEHIVAVCSLDGLVPIEIPADIRALLEPHLRAHEIKRSSP